MKAGGVQFADTPDEAAAHAEADPPARDRRPHAARRARGPARRRSSRSTTRAWSGTAPRKRPLILFSDMGGIDIEQVAEEHPDHVGRAPLLEPPPLLRLPGQAGDRRRGRDRQRAQPAHADRGAARAAVPRPRHDARRDQPAGAARGRQLRRARRAHGDGERGAAAPEGRAGQARHRRGRGHPRGPRAHRLRGRRQGDRRRRPPRRDPGQGHRLPRQPRARDRRRRRLADAHRRGALPGRQPGQLLGDRRQPVGGQGLRAGQAGAPEGRRREDRRDDVDRLQHPGRHRGPRRDQGLPRARQGPRRDDRDLPHPGRLGGGGLQDPRPLRRGVLRPLRLDARGRAARRGEDPGRRPA